MKLTQKMELITGFLFIFRKGKFTNYITLILIIFYLILS